MTEPSTPPDPPGPYEVVIGDEVMHKINALRPETIDGLADVIGRLRHDPDAADTVPLVPVRVDHAPGRPRTHVPATRAAGYLRDAVAEISPETVTHFDAEYQEMTRLTDEGGRDGQVTGLRRFTTRWVEYIALQGDHDTARHIDAAGGGEELAARFGAAMRRVHAQHFPDAGSEAGMELGVQTHARPAGGFTAVCPVTQLRAHAPSEDKAHARLRGLLLEWITG